MLIETVLFLETICNHKGNFLFSFYIHTGLSNAKCLYYTVILSQDLGKEGRIRSLLGSAVCICFSRKHIDRRREQNQQICSFFNLFLLFNCQINRRGQACNTVEFPSCNKKSGLTLLVVLGNYQPWVKIWRCATLYQRV